MILFIFVCFSMLMYPLEYWNKLTYFAPTFLAVWTFQNMVLCPNYETGYSGAYNPRKTTEMVKNEQQASLTAAFVVFCLGASWMTIGLLAKRTGQVLSFVLRSVFFIVIFYWTTHALVTTRLIVDEIYAA